MTSSKVSNLIYKSSKGSFAPTANEYLGGLHSIPFFIFSKPETIALAGLISLERWNQEVNIKRQLVDDGDLKNTLVQILRQSSNLKMY